MTVIARLAWKRLVRGRAIYLSAVLFVLPVAVALLVLRMPDAAERISSVGELAFRSLVLLAPVIHLAGALGEELDGQTYTYFWSRPIAREAVVLGKLLAIAPFLVVLSVAAVGLAFAIAGATADELARTLPAVALGTVAACAFAVGIGALVPRHPLVAALAWVLIAEQILPAVPAIQNLSVVHHVQVIAALPRQQLIGGGTPIGSVIALLLLTGLWLGIAIWRTRRIEPGSVSPS